MITTILAVFVIALTMSVLVTPRVRGFGIRFGAMDHPHERKVHMVPIPRVGGLAMVVAFFGTLALIGFLPVEKAHYPIWDRKIAHLFAGSLVVFGVGILDDFRHLSARIKLLAQIAAATLAFFGGVGIELFLFSDKPLGPIMSYGLTVFWFVLFINAVNLIDGLDGLAGGICFFTSAIMVIFSVLRGEHTIAILYAGLGGTVLGFLRYNFNPASIFMGDGGSYFLGYTIAGLSILGSQKSQVGAIILMPLLAMGIPVFDTLLSPIRRFIQGRDIFKPDKGHIHHQFIRMGFSARRTVLILYGITFALCLSAVILVNLRDEQAGLFLILLGAGAVIFTQKLGYFGYLAYDKIYGWFRDVSDVAGLTRDRRSFLNVQIDISASKSAEELWSNVGRAMDMLNFDKGILTIYGNSDPAVDSNSDISEKAQSSMQFTWTSDGYKPWAQEDRNDLLKLELPLLDSAQKNIGTLFIEKDVRRDPISHYTLRRIEHLRRTLTAALSRILAEEPGRVSLSGGL
jgi:UDP-GlcNAc:undecaprenyl-phosphate GlcNAc-1-phosphate transferase